MSARSAPTEYVVLVGLNYPDGRPGKPEKRADVGDVISDLPKAAVSDLLDAGVIAHAREDG